jgi:hypothetical protein
MATVMLLQALEGLSDAEATDRLEFDLRWRAVAGVDTGYVSFHPTSLVGQRNRLRSSARPRRLFEDAKVVAKETGARSSRWQLGRHYGLSTPGRSQFPCAIRHTRRATLFVNRLRRGRRTTSASRSV